MTFSPFYMGFAAVNRSDKSYEIHVINNGENNITLVDWTSSNTDFSVQTYQNNNLKIPEDWISNKVLKLENYNGDIPELSLKISQIRTWTYISNHQSWLTDPKYWQEKTQKIENDLSDNLHEGLTNKFIDVSSKFFIDTHSDYNIKKVELGSDQTINLDGENYGKIRGFELEFNKKSNSHSLFSLSHVKKSIRNMIEDKIDDFLNAPDDSLNFGDLSQKKII